MASWENLSFGIMVCKVAFEKITELLEQIFIVLL